MTDRIKGILIDPFTRTVSEWTAPEEKWTYTEIYAAIECGDRGFDCVSIPGHPDGMDALYVDDLGLYQGYEDFFTLAGYPHSLTGKCLLLGVDEEGDTVSARMNIEALRRLITWRKDRFIRTETYEEKVEIYGMPGTRITSVAIFESGWRA